MNITATLNGEVVTIVQLSVDDAGRLWVSYVDGAGVLKVTKKPLSVHTNNRFVVVATDATVN